VGSRRSVRERLDRGGAICGIAVAAIAGLGLGSGQGAADWLAEAVPLYHHLGWFRDVRHLWLIMSGSWLLASTARAFAPVNTITNTIKHLKRQRTIETVGFLKKLLDTAGPSG